MFRRSLMLADLQERHDFAGMTRVEVKGLLGYPNAWAGGVLDDLPAEGLPSGSSAKKSRADTAELWMYTFDGNQSLVMFFDSADKCSEWIPVPAYSASETIKGILKGIAGG